MDLNELKLVTASNIINLRTAAGMTQAELGAKLNYSDKTISKWERGEAIPDAWVLLQMASLFGVSVDELLSAHNKWEPKLTEAEAEAKAPDPSYSVHVLIAIVLLGVFTVGLAVYVTLWLIDIIEWRVFLVALSADLLVYLILDCVFLHRKHLAWIVGAFVLSLFVLAYFFLPVPHPWQLFLLAVPAEALVFLSFNIRRVPKVHRKSGKS